MPRPRRHKVVFTTRLPGNGIARLGQTHRAVVPARGTMSRRRLLSEMRDADALVALLTDDVGDELLERAPRLRVVANYAVGYNNVDVAAATARGVVVTNTPDVLTETTADLAMALILAVARRIPEGDALVRRGAFTGWAPEFFLGADVYGKTLGIVGLGAIGQAVARRARGFDMRILYADPMVAPRSVTRRLGALRRSKAALLQSSDFVSLHCPLNTATWHYIGEAELARMRPTAFLVNTARGPLVDEGALARALGRGDIAGAALDVFEDEPAVGRALLRSHRVVLAPHIGSATATTRTRMADLCIGSVDAVLRGRRPPHVVNPEVLR